MSGLLHLVRRGGAWAGWGPAHSPPRCTKCNSPPINGQCTNFILFHVALYCICTVKGYINTESISGLVVISSSSSGSSRSSSSVVLEVVALVTSCAARWPPQYAPAPWLWLLTFWPWSQCGSRMCQNAEKRCICHPKIQIYTNIFKFQTGVLCYNKEI